MGYRDIYKRWTAADFAAADRKTQEKAKNTVCGRLLYDDWQECFTVRGVYNLFCCFLFFVVGMAVTLIVVGVIVVKPFNETKDFPKTTCYVTKVEYDTKRVSCGCGKNCNSNYPCLEIYVNYTRFDNTEVFAMLHENERYFECTYATSGCSRDAAQNALNVLDYKAKYGYGNYSCYYNPAVGATDVLRAHLLNQDLMLHGMIWPACFFVIFTLLLVLVVCTCGCRFVCRCDPPQDVKDAAREAEAKNSNNAPTRDGNNGIANNASTLHGNYGIANNASTLDGNYGNVNNAPTLDYGKYGIVTSQPPPPPAYGKY